VAAPQRVLGDRYELLEQLGHGGMGSVWLAEDLLLRRRVALKQLIEHHGGEDHDQRRQHLVREARALARLNHPAIVQIYDILVEEGGPWIVMEYVRGRSLADLIDTAPLGVRATAEIGLHVLGALQAAHDAHVLHRDVKPSNIIVRDDGKVFLVDFGIAHITGTASATSGRALLGTPEFLAPERLAGAPAGPHSDLWSLGVTLYSMLEGRSPFRRAGGHDAAATMWAIMKDPPPPLTTTGPLADAVIRLLDKDPDRRLRADTLARVLRSVRSGRKAESSGTRPMPRPGPARQDPADRRWKEDRLLRDMSADEAAVKLSELPPESVREVLVGSERAFAGQVLLALPGERATQILVSVEALVAGELLDAMATRPDVASKVVRMLPTAHTARAVSHMERSAAATLIAALPAGEAARILGRMDQRVVADIIALLPAGTASRQLEAMSVSRACAVLNYVPPVTTAARLRDCADGRADRLLQGLRAPIRAQVLRHLRR
jgi:hypothetical protein